jgi:nitrogen fixation-related uncharacterized protein
MTNSEIFMLIANLIAIVVGCLTLYAFLYTVVYSVREIIKCFK